MNDDDPREVLALLKAEHRRLDEEIELLRTTGSCDQLELARMKKRKLIAKIDAAIRRLYDGEYGYCEVTGEPISLARLEARPIATMTLEAQEKHERVERVSRDD